MSGKRTEGGGKPIYRRRVTIPAHGKIGMVFIAVFSKRRPILVPDVCMCGARGNSNGITTVLTTVSATRPKHTDVRTRRRNADDYCDDKLAETDDEGTASVAVPSCALKRARMGCHLAGRRSGRALRRRVLGTGPTGGVCGRRAGADEWKSSEKHAPPPPPSPPPPDRRRAGTRARERRRRWRRLLSERYRRTEDSIRRRFPRARS